MEPKAYINQILLPRKTVGIYLNYNGKGDYKGTFLIIQKKKNGLSVTKTRGEFDGLDQLSKQIPSKFPLSISITGEGVLSQVADSEGSNPDNLLSGINNNDFVKQVYNGPNGIRATGLIRSNILEKIISDFGKHGLSICFVGTTPGICFNFLDLLSIRNKEVYCIGYAMIKSADDIWSVTQIDEDVVEQSSLYLGEESFSQPEFISFCVGAAYLLQIKIAQSGTIENERKDFLYKYAFTNGRLLVVSLMFILLLVNFFLFSTYQEKNQVLVNNKSGSLEKTKELQVLKTEYEQAKEFVTKNSLDKNLKIAFYVDRACIFRPMEIHLTNIQVNPVSGRLKNKKQIDFNIGTIRIDGKCSSSEPVGEWVGLLNNQDWIADVKKQEFSIYPGEKGEFSLELKIRNPLDDGKQ